MQLGQDMECVMMAEVEVGTHEKVGRKSIFFPPYKTDRSVLLYKTESCTKKV